MLVFMGTKEFEWQQFGSEVNEKKKGSTSGVGAGNRGDTSPPGSRNKNSKYKIKKTVVYTTKKKKSTPGEVKRKKKKATFPYINKRASIKMKGKKKVKQPSGIRKTIANITETAKNGTRGKTLGYFFRRINSEINDGIKKTARKWLALFKCSSLIKLHSQSK